MARNWSPNAPRLFPPAFHPNRDAFKNVRLFRCLPKIGCAAVEGGSTAINANRDNRPAPNERRLPDLFRRTRHAPGLHPARPRTRVLDGGHSRPSGASRATRRPEIDVSGMAAMHSHLRPRMRWREAVAGLVEELAAEERAALRRGLAPALRGHVLQLSLDRVPPRGIDDRWMLKALDCALRPGSMR